MPGFVTRRRKWKDRWCLRRFKSSHSFFKEKNELLTSQTRIGFRRNTRNSHFHEHSLLLDRRHVSGLCKTSRIDMCSLSGRRKKGRGRGKGEKRERGFPLLFPFLPIPYPFRGLLRSLGVRGQPSLSPLLFGINRRHRVRVCLFKRLYFNHFVCQKPFAYFQ